MLCARRLSPWTLRPQLKIAVPARTKASHALSTRPTAPFSSRAVSDDADEPGAMFETWTDAYDRWGSLSISREQERARDPGYEINLPCTIIRSLIASGLYKRANMIRKEYAERNVPIVKHQVYAQAALAALKAREHEDFLEWFELVPDRALVPGGRSFDKLFNVMTSGAQTNISTIIKWSLVAAEKGYLRDIYHFVVPYVLHGAWPCYSLAMVAGILENARIYAERHSHDPTVNATYDSSDVISIALLAAAADGRKYLGTMLVELSLSLKVSPSDYSLAMYMRDLRVAHEKNMLHHMRRLLNKHVQLIGKTAAEIELIDVRRTPSISTGPMYYALELPYVLRIIKSTILTDGPPTATAIAHFIARYTQLGRRRVIFMLRRKVLSAQRAGVLSLWFTAEMKFWLMYGRYDRVVLSYTTYFTRAGIPRGMMDQFVDIARQGPPPRAGKLAVARLDDLRPMPVPYRTTPSSHAHAILWSAFAHLAPTLDALEETYQGLLAVVDHFVESRDELKDALDNPGRVAIDMGRDPEQPEADEMQDDEGGTPSVAFHLRQAGHQLAKMPLPGTKQGKAAWRSLPPVMMPDASVFSPFINSFASLSGPQRAMQVLRDMHERDIAPGLQTWYYIQRAFVRANDLRGALRVLETVESFGPPNWEEFELVKTRVRTRFGALPSSSAAHEQHVATYHFYSVILRKLVLRQRFAEAQQFLDRMEALGYKPGFHPKFDRYVAYFKEQQAERRAHADADATGTLVLKPTADSTGGSYDASEPRWNPAMFSSSSQAQGASSDVGPAALSDTDVAGETDVDDVDLEHDVDLDDDLGDMDEADAMEDR